MNEQDDSVKSLILKDYVNLVNETWEIPSYSKMMRLGHTKAAIRHHYGNITELHDYAVTQGLLTSVSSKDVFSNKSELPVDKKIFVITTAVADSQVHPEFLASLKHFARLKDAQIVVLPCEDKVNSFQNDTAVFDPALADPSIFVVHQDTNINENLFLCSIQVSASQIKPITGLSRIGSREGSYIFASPKQFLEYVPTANQGKNYTIMTPGACTIPNYMRNTRYMSKRLSYIANNDHTLGAIIVEVESDKIFHFRHIQAAEDGSFIDLGVRYRGDAPAEHMVPTTVILGDLHGVNHDVDVLKAFVDGFAELNIKRLVLHDTFDGLSISHHIQEPGSRSARFKSSPVSDVLVDEAFETFKIVKKLTKDLAPEETIIVKSNHDEVIDKWIDQARFIDEPQNYRIGLELAAFKYDGIGDLLQMAMKLGILHNQDDFVFSEEDKETFRKLTFLKRDQPYKVGGVEIGAHGDLGSNGSKATLAQVEKIYGRCVVGHAHTAAIQRGVFRVGTFSKLNMNYNRGPSSWTQTAALLYEDGTCQLVNFINGKFYL